MIYIEREKNRTQECPVNKVQCKSPPCSIHFDFDHRRNVNKCMCICTNSFVSASLHI